MLYDNKDLKSNYQIKFQNLRERHDKDIPCVVAHKLNKSSVLVDGVKNLDTAGPLYCDSACLPQRPSGEDNDATNKHISTLQIEFKCKNPNMDRVNLLMKRTLQDRRQNIVEQATSVKQIVEVYPWLVTSEQLLEE